MKGLLLKDYYTLFKQMKIFILMIVVFSCLPGYSSSSFAIVYAAMLPITALAYDERSKWDSLAVMMPYSSKDIVLSKYLIGYAMITGVFVLTALAQGALMLIKDVPYETENIVALALTVCVAFVMQAVNLPVMFKLGVEKGRIAFFLAIAVTVFATMSLGGKLLEMISVINSNLVFILLASFITTLVFNITSIRVSTLIYQKKEF